MKFQNNYNALSQFSRKGIRNKRKSSDYGLWIHVKKSLLANRLKKDGFKVYKTKTITKVKVNKLDETNEQDIIVFKGN